MESDEMLSERQSIRESARQLKKYGSTCNHVRNNEYLIRHNLEQTDTLQGIALKYGCTTEQIRRVNRLFAQDSLFLRQYLMIPVDRDTSLQHNQQSKSLLSSRMNTPINDQHLPFASTTTESASATNSANTATTSSSNTKHDKHRPILSPEEENKRSIEDFLGKIDSTLAKTKNYVKNSQNSLNGTLSIDNNDDELNGPSSSTVSTAFGFTSSYQNIGGTNSTSTNNHNRTVVKSSLHRLEEQQDEFYQL